MSIERLLITHVRSILSADLELSPNANIFIGGNAEGKTTLLEAVHLLSFGRSFRTRNFNAVVTHGKEFLSVGGKTIGDRPCQLGLRQSRDGLICKVNGVAKNKVSELSASLPVLCFSPETPSNFTHRSEFRRAFLDWGCFQDDAYFLHHWRSFRRVLRQRNSAIKGGYARDAITAWDREFVRTSSLVTEARQRYVAKADRYLEDIFKGLGIDGKFRLQFRKGASGPSLAEDLYKNLDSDQRRGFTQLGAHRDDLVLKLDGRSLANEGSRGQIKLLAFSLMLLQAKILGETRPSDVVFLIDDLPSEFDSERQQLAVESALETGAQLFVTSVSPSIQEFFAGSQAQTFHVKHGAIGSDQ